MRYVFILLIWLILQTTASVAQQYPVFTQYYFNELVINPAYAGNHVQLSATAMYRNQWINLPGAPRTYNISAHSSLMKKKIGVGLFANHDEIGSYQNDHVYGMFSYMLHSENATLAMGLQVGANMIGANYSRLDLQSPDFDPSFTNFRGLKPNVGGGIFYTQKKFFVGFSVPFIINSGVSNDDVLNQIVQRRYYYFHTGALLDLRGSRNLKYKPSLLVRTQEGQPLSFDINNELVFYEAFSVGLSVRSGDSFITFVSLKLSENFYFSYSYDLTSSTLNKFSNGSHEFVLNYRFKINSVHKNLECPHYYGYR